MGKTLKDLSILLTATLILTFLVWLPHILSVPNFWGLNFKAGFDTIYKNFDGLEYVFISKSYYRREIMATLPQSLQATYLASHFPGYSVLINIFAPFLGYLKSMLFVSLLSTIAACFAFYFLVKNFKLTSSPLFLSFLFLILPARWVIVHSVGSSEPLFIFLVILSLYFFMKFEASNKIKYILLASLAGVGAQVTRPPGILLAIAYLLYIHYKAYLEYKTLGFKKAFFGRFKYISLALIPISLIGIFYLFQINLGDFWAYFHSGDNIHLTFPPFQIFNKYQFWVGDIWLEDAVYIFIFGLLGGIMLWKQKLYPLAFFTLTYFFAASLVVHRDISRYLLPISPFVLIAFEKALTSKEFKIILPIVLLIIYLYSQNFIIENVAPYPNVGLFN
jgi:hypothetical protein